MSDDLHVPGELKVDKTARLSRLEVINDDIQIGAQGGPVNLQTFNCGEVTQGSVICVKGSSAEPPTFFGAEYYFANNFNTQNVPEDGIATEFMSMTSRTDTNNIKQFHEDGDNMAVFGSRAFSGYVDGVYNTKAVGGLLTQASQNHELGKLGTRLVFCYTPNDSSTVIPGAILDSDGSFISGHQQIMGNLSHKGQAIGFFNADPISRPEVEVLQAEEQTTVGKLITELAQLGLISKKVVK